MRGATDYLGIDDGDFIRDDVPMTKKEIRILTVAAARILAGYTVCDVGAGTGSLTVEAARQAGDAGCVFAVEKNPVGAELIKKNAEKFNLGNIRIINAEAPEGLESLPPLDAAIIGGSGQNLPQIFAALDEKLKKGGRIVINAITMQTLTEIFTVLKEYDGYKTETVSAQVNRLHKAGAHDMFLALNPVYILTCEKRR